MLAPAEAICAVRSASPPGTIADHGGEAAEPAIGHQASFDHAAQDIRVDISSAEKKNDALAGQFRELTG